MSEITVDKKQALISGMKSLFDGGNEIFFVSLATEDGFPVYSLGIEHEKDKFAAMNSTITVLSNSCSKEILKEEFSLTTIESRSGNILFVKTKYAGLSCVLMVSSRSNTTTLAMSRYRTVQMAKRISNI